MSADTEGIVQVAVELAGYKRVTDGNVEIQELSKRARSISALKSGLIGLALTTAMIAIPILHFILVPLGLVMTVMIVLGALGKSEKIIGGEGICPYCDASIKFVPRAPKFPFLERCEQCSQESSVNKR